TSSATSGSCSTGRWRCRSRTSGRATPTTRTRRRRAAPSAQPLSRTGTGRPAGPRRRRPSSLKEPRHPTDVEPVTTPAPSAASRLRRALASSYLEQHPAHALAFVLIAAALAAGAVVGVGFVAGPREVLHRLAHPHLLWLPVAFGATVVSYLGYMFAYRECAAAEQGADLRLADVDALELAGLPRREARVRALSLGTLEYAVLAPTAFAVSLLLLASGARTVGIPLSWAIGLPAGALVALPLLRRRRSLASARGWRARLAHALDGIAHAIALV